MAKIRKATAEERAKYPVGPGEHVYPLWGFAEVTKADGEKVQAYVEDLRGSWGKEDPQYELMVPDGHTMEDCHSLLCLDLKDLKDRACNTAEPCNCDGDCAEYWKKNGGFKS